MPVGIGLVVFGLISLISLFLRNDFSTVDNVDWLIVLTTGGASVLFFLWLATNWQGNEFKSFGAIVMLIAIFNRLLYTLDLIINGQHFEEWPLTTKDPQMALLKGEIITVVGILILVFSWHYASRLIFRHNSLSRMTIGSARGYWAMYVLAISVGIARKLFPQEVATAGELSSVVFAGGLASLLALYASETFTYSRLILVTVMSMPFIYLSLGTGMKENTIVAALPCTIAAWQTFRNWLARAFLIIAGAIAISVLTAYVGFHRDLMWYTSAGNDLTISELMQEFVARGGVQEEAILEGAYTFLKRNNAMYHRGWATDFADTFGVSATEILGPLGYIFIPRVIWSEKPKVNPGLEHTARVYGYFEAEAPDLDSSTAAGYFTALYMGTGYVGVIVGAITIALIVVWSQRLVCTYGDPYTAGLFTWMMFLFALRVDETWPVYALSAPMISLLYAFLFGRLIALLSRFRFVPSRARAPA